MPPAVGNRPVEYTPVVRAAVEETPVTRFTTGVTLAIWFEMIETLVVNAIEGSAAVRVTIGYEVAGAGPD